MFLDNVRPPLDVVLHLHLSERVDVSSGQWLAMVAVGLDGYGRDALNRAAQFWSVVGSVVG